MWWMWLVCGKCVEIERCWIWAVISWSLNISVYSSGIASGTVAWSSNTAERGCCHAVYINRPSGHVKVTRPAKFLVEGAVLHRHNVLSGKDDARWQVRPDLAATRPRSPLPGLNLWHKEKIPVLHTAEVHHITVDEEHYGDTIQKQIM